MTESGKYTPLSERLQQDVWHDNFVPKYSALASARPSKLVLIGVWLIFAPMALSAITIGLVTLTDSPDVITAVISVVGSAISFTLAILILFTQTRRYRVAKMQVGDSGNDDDDSPHDPGKDEAMP